LDYFVIFASHVQAVRWT